MESELPESSLVYPSGAHGMDLHVRGAEYHYNLGRKKGLRNMRGVRIRPSFNVLSRHCEVLHRPLT
jgi:hypothetical protein